MALPALLASAAPYLIGGAAGALSGLLGGQSKQGNFLQGNPAQNRQLSTLTPQQQGLQNQSINQAMALLQGRGGDTLNQFLGPIEQRAREQFHQTTIPSLAERFTSLNAQNSSAFQGALGRASGDLESSLAAMRGQTGLNLLQTLLGAGNRSSFENLYTPRSPGFLELGAGSLAGSGGQALSLMALLSLLGGNSNQSVSSPIQNRLGGGFSGIGNSSTPFNLPSARQALLGVI